MRIYNLFSKKTTYLSVNYRLEPNQLLKYPSNVMVVPIIDNSTSSIENPSSALFFQLMEKVW